MAAPNAVTSVVARTGDWHVALVGLELQEQVHHRRPAVGAQLGHGPAGRLAHCVEDVAALIGDGLDRSPGKVRPAGALRDADDRAPRLGIPPRTS